MELWRGTRRSSQHCYFIDFSTMFEFIGGGAEGGKVGGASTEEEKVRLFVHGYNRPIGT